ncbi:hypothetical protein NDU88_001865 [Pleurodeles waltl]|uniref:Uncharacterized protein n=1 Tax=Pleurodeles waltl TaxID=8319 RepID=A0AAV7TJH3_PLEWA|nr:hypothetical protein NDU88_001865 [Pleurodeles waltl]
MQRPSWGRRGHIATVGGAGGLPSRRLRPVSSLLLAPGAALGGPAGTRVLPEVRGACALGIEPHRRASARPLTWDGVAVAALEHSERPALRVRQCNGGAGIPQPAGLPPSRDILLDDLTGPQRQL